MMRILHHGGIFCYLLGAVLSNTFPLHNSDAHFARLSQLLDRSPISTDHLGVFSENQPNIC